MINRYWRSVSTITAILLLVLLTVVAQDRREEQKQGRRESEQPQVPKPTPRRTPPIIYPVPEPTSLPLPHETRGNPTPTPSPVPTPTPQIVCSTCAKRVPLFNLEEGTLPSRIKLWEGLETPRTRADVLLKRTERDTAMVELSFINLTSPPPGSRYYVWARLPTDEFLPLGELVEEGKVTDILFRRELGLKQLGIFVTLESESKIITPMDKSVRPSGVIVATAAN